MTVPPLLKWAFGFREVPAFDPFLLLDDFRSNDPRHYLMNSREELQIAFDEYRNGTFLKHQKA